MNSRDLSYIITSSEVEVGKIVVTETENANVKINDSFSQINLKKIRVNFIYFQRTRSEWLNTELTLFDQWLVGKDDRYHFNGIRENGSLRISAYKGKSKDLKNIEWFTGAQTPLHPDNSDQMILDFFSSEESEGGENVPLNYYDTIDLELEEYLMNLPIWKGAKTIKVFYTDSLERKRVTARYLRNENVQLANMGFACDVFSLVVDKEVITLWLTKDPKWGVLTVQEKNEKDGLEFTTLLQTE